VHVFGVDAESTTIDGVHPLDVTKRFCDRQPVAQGGMGSIESAQDPVIGRRVAIKSLRPELRDDERAVLKFIEEARVTGQLEHPNVVPIYDLGEGHADPFIVMRLIEGKSLAQLLAQSPKPAAGAESVDLLQRVVQVVLRVCDALSFAHSRGVYHCDVKPDNIMVGEHGQVYLMDWGVAVTDQPREGFGGTVAYMAPEQLLGNADDVDARTDVFLLGGLLFEILTGAAPNEGKAVLAAARWDGTRNFAPRQLWQRLPPELCRIAAKALAREPEARYQTVAAFRDELEKFLKGGGWFETLTAKAGEAIVNEGEPGSTAYIIQSGACDVWKLFQGQPRLVRRLGPGDVFGETAVFAGGFRTASIVAVDDVILKVITGDSLNRELDQSPILAAFVRSLASLFREADAALSGRGVASVDSPPPEPKT
jgi:eukaryotic-like serine/threonine-protein kinase